MNTFFATSIADQRHDAWVAEAEDYRRIRATHSARGSRPSRRHTAARRIVSRPVYAFQTWLAAGQL